MRTFELQSLECSFLKLVTQCLIDHVLRKSDRGGLILSRISAEFFNVFPFALKSVQFTSELFPLFVGAFSNIMEKPELSFPFAEAEFWIVSFFQYYQHGFYLGHYSMICDYRK